MTYARRGNDRMATPRTTTRGMVDGALAPGLREAGVVVLTQPAPRWSSIP